GSCRAFPIPKSRAVAIPESFFHHLRCVPLSLQWRRATGRWPNEALTATPVGDILASSYLRGASVIRRIVTMTSLAAGRIETDERSQQRKFEHDRRLRRGFAAGAFVEAMGRHIRLIGEDPRLGAPEPPSALEEGLEKPARESAPPVRLC